MTARRWLAALIVTTFSVIAVLSFAVTQAHQAANDARRAAENAQEAVELARRAMRLIEFEQAARIHALCIEVNKPRHEILHFLEVLGARDEVLAQALATFEPIECPPEPDSTGD